MPARIPEDAADLASSSTPVVVSFRDGRGRIIAIPMWVEHTVGVLRFSTPKGSRKSAHLRRDPEVGFLFTDPADPYRYLSASGRVVAIQDDTGLATIDRLSHRYVGGDYEDRDQAREVFVIEPSRVVYAPGASG